MLAYVAGSASTDLNVWERMACPCVSQAVCQSATTASVVWPLALDFIFTQCVSPCPWNFNIGCCANEKPLRLIAHRRVRFFTFMFVSTGGRGGNSLNPIQASENIMILETNDCTSSVRWSIATWLKTLSVLTQSGLGLQTQIFGRSSKLACGLSVRPAVKGVTCAPLTDGGRFGLQWMLKRWSPHRHRCVLKMVAPFSSSWTGHVSQPPTGTRPWSLR